MRFWRVRRLGTIFFAILAGVCSKEAGQLWLCDDWQNYSDVVTDAMGGVAIGWKRWLEGGKMDVLRRVMLLCNLYIRFLSQWKILRTVLYRPELVVFGFLATERLELSESLGGGLFG